MNKIKKYLSKLGPLFACCLTLVLAINANSASCFIINQPKEPDAIKKFKIFK